MFARDDVAGKDMRRIGIRIAQEIRERNDRPVVTVSLVNIVDPRQDSMTGHSLIQEGLGEELHGGGR